jgi:hypothetical protein
MVRHRMHVVAELGKYRDALAWVSELNSARRELGLPELKAWSPIAGDFNYLILESEYADLAAYSNAQDKFNADPTAMAVFRRGRDWGAHDHWPKDEILETAPTIA